MLRNWRIWVLIALIVVPFGLYVVLGSLWLLEHGWAWATAVAIGWIGSYGLFAFLADRWTRSSESLLPPLDWEAPQTFTPRDRAAWAIVEEMARRSDNAAIESLSRGDIYINTGRELAEALAQHYHPGAKEPIDRVPVVELLTALELAAEDLARLCRQVPGGDIITPGHWKQAIDAANLVNRANEIYTYLLPLFAPVAGVARLGTQKLIAQPAWRSMQRSLMRWFFRAYVNRLGHHLVELYSGRLAIGSEHYRRLTRRAGDQAAAAHADAPKPVIGVAGAKGAGKSLLIASLEKVIGDGELAAVKSKLLEAGREPGLADRLGTATFLEIPGYRAQAGPDTSRERASRKDAVAAAGEVDLLVLVADASRGDLSDDLNFAREWIESYSGRPHLDRPPAFVVVTGFDRLRDAMVVESTTSGGGSAVGTRVRPLSREEAIAALKAELPEGINRVIAVELGDQPAGAVAEAVLPAIARRLPEAERIALLRHLHEHSTRSKARRVVSAIGRQGKALWRSVRKKAASRADYDEE
ncbi:GTPase [Tautonia sociabilis]|uniref:GTPase n=1 Tax=Tautonia sociabilis TaxID=2080755 RepID=UPI001F29E176|nr:GTPase [Tautonia sociabilis]